MREALLNSTLPEYFHNRVKSSIESLGMRVTPDAEFYLVNLLTHFSQSEKLFERDENGELIDKALAMRLADAVWETRDKKIPILKKMGDVALYTSGFFGDALLGKMVGLDYYINMGHTAYSSLSTLVRDEKGSQLSELFDELASQFHNFVEVLASISSSEQIFRDQDLLKLYERWLATGSQHAQAALVRQGITPTELGRMKGPQ